jgi:DNA repair protein RecN (Recombination protein N)
MPGAGGAGRGRNRAPDPSDGELILRRVNGSDGRKTAFVNDRRVSGEVLRDLSDRWSNCMASRMTGVS